MRHRADDGVAPKPAAPPSARTRRFDPQPTFKPAQTSARLGGLRSFAATTANGEVAPDCSHRGNG
jgi:hypothetical protein